MDFFALHYNNLGLESKDSDNRAEGHVGVGVEPEVVAPDVPSRLQTKRLGLPDETGLGRFLGRHAEGGLSLLLLHLPIVLS